MQHHSLTVKMSRQKVPFPISASFTYVTYINHIELLVSVREVDSWIATAIIIDRSLGTVGYLLLY